MIALRRVSQTGLVLAVALLVAVAYLGWRTGTLPRPPADWYAQPAPAAAASTWFALEDGTIVRRAVDGAEVARIETTSLKHVYAKTATQIGWDSRQQLLWFSDSHSGIRSWRADASDFGPSLSFADAGLVGCATVSDGRPFAIDEVHRRIIVPVGTGGMLIYNADRLSLDATIPPGVLENEPGFLPALAIDDQGRMIWYAAQDGSIVELNVARLAATGRRILFANSPHDVRALAIRGDALQILGVEGTITTIALHNLDTLGTRHPVDDAVLVGLAVGD